MNLRRFRNQALLGLVAAVLSLFASKVRADERRPDCYVLSIGVDAYQKANRLHGCVNDARNIVAAFQSQEGTFFGKVQSRIQLDGEATKAGIVQHLEQMKRLGQAGDFIVLFLSGHGGRNNGDWFFLPVDYDQSRHAATHLSDRQLLAAAQALIEQGKKVLVIVDACHAGQLRRSARGLLDRRNAGQGGLILMLSSMPNQTSAALGQYSAYAKAVVDALAGQADLDGDGYITLREVRRFAYERTYQLLRQSNVSSEQDGECDWSLSISENLRVASSKRAVTNRPPTAPAKSSSTTWVGSEKLAGYDKLAFQLLANNKAIMTDAQGNAEGTWSQTGNAVTLRFFSGRVVYTGTLQGTTLSGTARNEQASWSWSVQFEQNGRTSSAR